MDVYPLVDDATNSCLAVELSPSSFGLYLANRYWRSANFANDAPFAPFAGPDTVTPVAGQWNRVTLGFNSSDFPSKVGDRIQVTIRGHKFAIDNVILTKGPQNFYISQSTGSDFNDGMTPSTPLQSFTQLNGRAMAPGSAVYLKRGDTWATSKLSLSGKGTSLLPITLSAYGDGAHPIITGINTTTEACVVIDNPSHWQINSLDLRNSKVGLYLRFAGGNLDGTGAMFNNSNVTITGMNFQNMNALWSDGSGNITVVSPYELSWGAGIWIGGNIPSPPGGPWASASTPILDGLTVTHSSFQNCSTGVGNNWYFPPIYKSRLTNVLLEDLWVTGCENGSTALFHVDGGVQRRVDTWLGGTGFYSTGTTGGFIESVKNFIIEDCEFAFNKRNNTGNDGSGFDVEGDTENVILRHNVLHDNDGCGLLILPTNGDNVNLQMTSNTQWNNCRNPKDNGQNKELIYSRDVASTGSISNTGVYLGTDIIPSTLAVYNNTTRWNSDFSPTGMRTGTSWASVSSRPTSWAFTSSVEGWGNTNNWTGFAASGGSLVGTSSGVDPYVESAATWVNTRERRWVLISMSSTSGTTGQVFFQTETDATWTAGKSATFTVIPDGTLRDYVVDMSQSTEYRGVVTRYRLDPTSDAGATLAINSFGASLAPYLESATAYSGREVDVVFNQPMLPQGGVMNPANYTISGAGQGTLNTSPNSVTQLATASGPVYRLTWYSGGATAAPATITVVNAQAARGHAISAANAQAFTAISGPASVTGWQFFED